MSEPDFIFNPLVEVRPKPPTELPWYGCWRCGGEWPGQGCWDEVCVHCGAEGSAERPLVYLGMRPVIALRTAADRPTSGKRASAPEDLPGLSTLWLKWRWWWHLLHGGRIGTYCTSQRCRPCVWARTYLATRPVKE